MFKLFQYIKIHTWEHIASSESVKLIQVKYDAIFKLKK